MASVKSDISLLISNDLNRSATFSILGGTQDPSNGQANSKTIYEWDLSGETFANTNVLTIQASTTLNPTVILYEVANQDGAITDLQTVVRLLNTLNLGIFNLDGNVLWIIDDLNIFGNINVLVSLNFDIDVFVSEAYNYFDNENKTTLVDFSNSYKGCIEQAVNTIPNFVDLVDSQGWSLCYPTNADSINITRTVLGNVFITEDTAGVTTTNQYATLTITANGYDFALLYSPDILVWNNINFDLQANVANSFVYKYVFSGSLEFNFNNNFFGGWTLLAKAYFPVNGNPQGTTEFRLPSANQLLLYGQAFPDINVGQDSSLFIQANPPFGSSVIDLAIPAISFGQVNDGNSVLEIRDIQSAGGIIGINWDSYFRQNQGQVLSIIFKDNFTQTINFDDQFANAFNYGIQGQSGESLTLTGSLGLSDSPIYEFESGIPLITKVRNIDFSNSFSNDLPPLNEFGFFDGALNYELNFSLLRQQSVPVGQEMAYFNNWFFELGTQSKLSQNSATLTSQIDTSTGNTFVLSGQGYSGYQALIENGFTINTPVGAVVPSVFTFTVAVGQTVPIQTVGAIVNSLFEITSAQKNSLEIVTPSNNTGGLVNQVLIPASAITPTNCIFTVDPTNDCAFFNINGVAGNYDSLTSFIVGGGLFNLGVSYDQVEIGGLTITLPLYPNTTRGDAYGLFNRDFNGLNGTNVVNELKIFRYKINTTDILNTLVLPYGSNALFNISGTGFVPSISNISFTQCIFGSDEIHIIDNPSPLDILLPISALLDGGTELIGCSFNFQRTAPPPNTTQAFFNINNNSAFATPTKTALLGVSVISGCTFDAIGLDTIILNGDYDGNGNSIQSLTITNNPQVGRIQRIGVPTTLPPACTLTISIMPVLTFFSFEGYNLTSISLSSLPLVSNFDVSNNALNSANLDTIINLLSANGLSNGFLDYSGQAGGVSPNIGVSGTAYNDLILNGWFISGNVPI